MRKAKPSEMRALARAAEAVGGQAVMAISLGFANRAGVQPWFSEVRRVPVEYCPHIERLCAERGKPVTCEELRSDVFWRRLPDASWPFHSGGRPMVDFSRTPLPEPRKPLAPKAMRDRKRRTDALLAACFTAPAG